MTTQLAARLAYVLYSSMKISFPANASQHDRNSLSQLIDKFFNSSADVYEMEQGKQTMNTHS